MTNIAMKLMASQVGDNYDDVDGNDDDDDEDGDDGEDEVIDDAGGIWGRWQSEAQKPKTFRVATFYAQKLSGQSAWNRFPRQA